MNVDQLFDKEYNLHHYNCVHFLRDAWHFITGENIEDSVNTILRPVCKEKGFEMRLKNDFIRISKPVTPCIIVLHRAKCAPHVGIWINGKILHLAKTGVELMPLEIVGIGFDRHRFYLCSRN